MNEHTDRIDSSLLDRYLAGECTPAEAARAREWLAAHPERERLAATLGARPVANEQETDAAWRRLSTRIARPARPVVAWPAAGALRIAAAVLILLGGALLWRQLAGPESGTAPVAYALERATAVGESAALRLADGTLVTLAPASRLRVGAGYGEGAREVELEGEALFSVAHDAARPFRVHAAGATTEVLGTEFAVRATAGEPGVRVVVASGRVALRSADDAGVVLAAGDLGEVGEAGRVTAERGIDVSRYLAWSAGRLVFEDTPLVQVLAELERWHHADLAAPDPALASRTLTATFPVGQPLPEVLASIALAVGARVEQQGPTLRLEPTP